MPAYKSAHGRVFLRLRIFSTFGGIILFQEVVPVWFRAEMLSGRMSSQVLWQPPPFSVKTMAFPLEYKWNRGGDRTRPCEMTTLHRL